MDPVTVGIIAAGAVNAIGQWMSSKDAQEANAADRAKMAKLASQLQNPNFDVSNIDPQDYTVLQKYIPKQAKYIAEQNPDLVKASEDAKSGRSAQLSALDRLKARGEGRDVLQDAAIGQANRENAIASNAANQSLLQQYARRGGLNSGSQLAAQLSSQSNSFDRGGQMGLQSALARDQSSLDALRQAGSLGSDIYNQDISLASKNADIINSFNQRNATYGRDYENQRIGNENNADLYNVNQAQSLANSNVDKHNAARLSNRNYGNTMAQQGYTNNLDRVRAASGLSAANQAANTQMAQDRNSAIQGVSNGVISGMMYNQKSPQAPAAAPAAPSSQLGYDEYYKKQNDIFDRTS